MPATRKPRAPRPLRNKPLLVYKMRAECSADIGEFLRQHSPTHASFESSFPPDCEFTFASPLSLAELRAILRTIEDGHVMLETVQPLELYTGVRPGDCD